MKQYAILHDAIRNQQFGSVVKDGGTITYFGIEQQAKEWASRANSYSFKSAGMPTLPDGVIIGSFRFVTDLEIEKLTGQNVSGSLNHFSYKDYRLNISGPLQNTSRVPAVMDTPISHFKNSQYSKIVRYKALCFISDSKSASFLSEVKSNNYAYDIETARFNRAPSYGEHLEFRQKIESTIGRGHERRLGLKVLKQEEFSSKRTAFGKEDILEQKALGNVIGGTARRARRLGRAATASFNPRAWDGDNDGLVQEGTAFERPAVPGVNDFGTRGRVNARAATRAFQQASNAVSTGKRTDRTGAARARVAVGPAKSVERRGMASVADILKAFKNIGFDAYTEEGRIHADIPADSPLGKFFKRYVAPLFVGPPTKRGVINLAPSTHTNTAKSKPGEEIDNLVRDFRINYGIELNTKLDGKNSIHHMLRAGSKNELEKIRKRLAKGEQDDMSKLFGSARMKHPKTGAETTLRDLIDEGYSLGPDGLEAPGGSDDIKPPSAPDGRRGPGSRRGRPAQVGLRSRRQTAVIDKTKAPKKRRKGGDTPGVDKVDPSDGSAWESLTDDQKKNVAANIKLLRRQLEDLFKTKHADGWWEGWATTNKVSLDSPFSSAAIVDLQYDLQEMVKDIERDKNLTDEQRAKQLTSLQKILRDFDDLQALSFMVRDDNFSLLEHLHPATRRAAFGRTNKTAQNWAAANNEKFLQVIENDTSLPETVRNRQESTIFGKFGGVRKYIGEGKETTEGTAKTKRKTGEKLQALSRRLYTPNPKRVARKERRRARKMGTSRRAEEVISPRSKIRQRIRRAQRGIQARLRGNETPEQILARNNSSRIAHPLGISGDTPDTTELKVTPKFVERLAFIGREVAAAKSGEKTSDKRSQKVQDVALLQLWENMENNGLPTYITEDQASALIAAGYKYHNRGVGNDPGFVEEYLSNPDRFIPGIGGRAYGTGEYWAPPGSGHAWGYGTAQIVGFVSPNARTIKADDLSRVIEEGKTIEQAIRAFDKGLPDGEAMKMDPKDYFDQLMSYLSNRLGDGKAWDGQLGQIYRQMLEMYSKSSSDEKKRRELWAALQYLHKMFSHEQGYFAPLLGYDAVWHNGVTLVHNRGAMIVVGKPLTVDSGRQIVANAKRDR